MNRIGLLVAMLVVGCRPTPAPTGEELGDVGTIAVTQSTSLFHAARYTAPGDTLDYTLTCTPIARATGYRWNTTTAGLNWSGMLVNVSTTGCSVNFKPINTSAWDSTSFTACVRGTRGTDSSKTAGCVTWKVIRGLGPMQPPAVDSSRVITALYVFPESTAVNLLANKQFCNYYQALDGMIRMQNGQETLSDCQLYYDMLPPGIRPPGYTTALEFKPNTRERWRDDITIARGELPIEQKYKVARMLFASR